MILWRKGWPTQTVHVVCALLCGVLQGGLPARAGVGWDCQGSRTWPQGHFRPQRSPSADAIMPAKVRSKSLLACLCTSALHLLRTNAMSIPARATRLSPRGPSGATRTPGLLLPKQARCQLRYTWRCSELITSAQNDVVGVCDDAVAVLHGELGKLRDGASDAAGFAR